MRFDPFSYLLGSWEYAMMKLLVALLFMAQISWAGESGRPENWAVPIELPGVGNLHRVNETLYRSGQPTKEGMIILKEKIGINTVINLRVFHSDADEVMGTGLLNEELSVKTWHIEDEDVVRVLKLIRNKEKGPFLIHCWHGADRTGLMSAMYRIVEQDWPKDEAINEMVDGGYGFHPTWANIIKYIRNVDVKRIKIAVSK
jgi:protein tyrosine/serine phosphatase